MSSSSHLPRTTGEARLGEDVTVRTLAWPAALRGKHRILERDPVEPGSPNTSASP